jgi:hypothetical protein
VLAAAVFAALILRSWGLAHALPAVYNPDEVSILSRALSLADRGLDPGNFVYPSLYFYVLAAAVGALFAGQLALGMVDGAAAFAAAFWTDPSAFYVTGRLVSVAAGIGTVLVAYALGRRAGGQTPARVAAWMMALAYIPVRDAHFVKHDVAAALAIALTALLADRIRRRGARTDWALAGAAAGLAVALHYYAIVAVAPVVAAAIQRERGIIGAARSRGLWIACAGAAGAFALGSPYVIVDWPTAWRDILANRAIIVDRARDQYGLVGAGLEQVRLAGTMGAGWLALAAAAAGGALLWLRQPRDAAWLLSAPIAMALLLTQTWPFGRSQNALYPFVAVLAGVAVDRLARLAASPCGVATALTMLLAAQPLWHSVVMNRLITRDDTRTTAARWIEEHVPAGTGVAVEPGGVQLVSDRIWLLDTLARQGSGAEPGARARGWLARDPYPSPAYRVTFLGDSGLDRDKRFLSAAAIVAQPGLSALREAGIEYVVIERSATDEPEPLHGRLQAEAARQLVAWPFNEATASGPAFVPDLDVPPSLAFRQPGPIVEVWRVLPRK